MPKSTVQKSYFLYQKQPVLVKMYLEQRKNTRFSIGKNAVIIRMPFHTSKAHRQQFVQQLETWTIKQFDERAKLRANFFGKIYKNGDTIKIMGKEYPIHIQLADRKTHFARIKNNEIYITLSQHDQSPFQQKAIKTLLSRTIAGDCLPNIERLVDQWNDQYFQEDIQAIRLKQNQSNWGSCSSNRNLNFSTRLLFAPSDVIDYVIVHELAHLKELNHSAKFWKIVADVMPDYKEKEEWLKENGHLCSF